MVRHYECKGKDLPALFRIAGKPLETTQLSETDRSYIHLLKLVTGVEISTRPVSRSGNEGNAAKRSRRNAEAALNSKAFRRSMTIAECSCQERATILP